MSDENKWGGRREDAGRPSLSDEDTVRKTVTVPESVAAFLEKRGDGNLSAGVRDLAAEAMKE